MEKTTKLSKVDNIKSILANQYQKQLNNYFGDEKKAMKIKSSKESKINEEIKKIESANISNDYHAFGELYGQR